MLYDLRFLPHVIFGDIFRDHLKRQYVKQLYSQDMYSRILVDNVAIVYFVQFLKLP